jgi:hypothetical protein
VTDRDGSRDFDPLIGAWSLRLKRRLRPLTGSTEWVEFAATSVCRKVWGGRAQLDELHGRNPIDGSEIEGLTLRLYNPESREWRLYWANSRAGVIGTPQVGRFLDGRGVFLDHDTLEGRPIVIRYEWTRMDSESPHFEQSFSADDGASWEVNWITDQSRVPEPPAP